MKKIQAATILVVSSGQVTLTPEQAKPRLHCLDIVKPGPRTSVYAVNSPIQFKAGEEFGFDGDVGKNGILSDPAAEQLKTLEGLDQARATGKAEGRAEVERETEKLRAGLQAEIDKAFEAGKAAGRAEAAAAVAPQP